MPPLGVRLWSASPNSSERLDVQVAPRLSVQVMPVLQVLQRLGEPLAFHPTQSRVQLESVGRSGTSSADDCKASCAKLRAH